MYWPYAQPQPEAVINRNYMRWLANCAPREGWHFEFENDGEPSYHDGSNGPYPDVGNKIFLCHGERRTAYFLQPMQGEKNWFFCTMLLVNQPAPPADADLDALIAWLQSMPREP